MTLNTQRNGSARARHNPVGGQHIADRRLLIDNKNSDLGIEYEIGFRIDLNYSKNSTIKLAHFMVSRTASRFSVALVSLEKDSFMTN